MRRSSYFHRIAPEAQSQGAAALLTPPRLLFRPNAVATDLLEAEVPSPAATARARKALGPGFFPPSERGGASVAAVPHAAPMVPVREPAACRPVAGPPIAHAARAAEPPASAGVPARQAAATPQAQQPPRVIPSGLRPEPSAPAAAPAVVGPDRGAPRPSSDAMRTASGHVAPPYSTPETAPSLRPPGVVPSTPPMPPEARIIAAVPAEPRPAETLRPDPVETRAPGRTVLVPPPPELPPAPAPPAPQLRIGTLEVRVVPPPLSQPPAIVARPAPRAPARRPAAAPIARGFGIFGLGQS